MIDKPVIVPPSLYGAVGGLAESLGSATGADSLAADCLLGELDAVPALPLKQAAAIMLASIHAALDSPDYSARDREWLARLAGNMRKVINS